MKSVVDQAIRERALEIETSFIVQAPAGSGKTTLLIQRYLALLAHSAKNPEEILAITFTRKAAAEMRHRIVSALVECSAHSSATHENNPTLKLAKAVLEKDAKLHWQLLKNPERLRIQTIDSFCANICARLPILSRFGIQPKIVEHPDFFYEQAVMQLFIDFNENPVWAPALEYLLSHFDNRVSYLQNLFVEFLMLRDQWISYVIPHHENLEGLKSFLEEGLAQVSLEAMKEVKNNIPSHIIAELMTVVRNAAENLLAENSNSAIIHCIDLQKLPDVTLDALPQWAGLVKLFLTQEGTWRAAVDKRIGLLPKSREKSCFLNLLATLQDNAVLLQHLQNLMVAPPPHYTASQWQILKALMQILPILLAQLQLVFQKNEIVDFVELNLAALQALGEPEQPTDLTLYFDYRIQHILVDEFQDTSIMQFHLLERLTAGWEKTDGRTLFLVGDPMQSIYRFRNAEVGLFLQAKQNGIGNIFVESLTLQTNFRSEKILVDWTNENFQQIFPKSADIATGAVPHAAAIAKDSNHTNGKTTYHIFSDENNNEAEKLVEIVKEYQLHFPEESIAILVRSRRHLPEIITTLQAHALSFQAIDIQPLSNCMEIQDLFSLTHALFDCTDHLAWLSILRAPWCGLNLNDIYILSQKAKGRTLYETLNHFHEFTDLSADSMARLTRIVPILNHSLANKGRLSLTQWIKGTWIALGGPASLQQKNELSNVEAYFKLLRKWEEEQPNHDLQQLRKQLLKLYAEPDPHANSLLQIMTIHKAKGLEFDHVIIPGLARRPPHDKRRLFLWHERPNQLGKIDLILGPLQITEDDHDPIYRYLQRIDKNKARYETARLLYVAITRAKKSLHLMAEMEPQYPVVHKLKNPIHGSFMDLLWPLHQEIIEQAAFQNTDVKDISTTSTVNPGLKRLLCNWQAPLLPNGLSCASYMVTNSPSPERNQRPEDSANEPSINDAQILGTVIHEGLQQIAESGLIHWDKDKIFTLETTWKTRLSALGYTQLAIQNAVHTLQQALCGAITHERGRWIFSSEHQDAHNEYRISIVHENQIHHLVIDRCFIDAEGTRWIIDYKTSRPQQISLELFLNFEKQQYEQQLSLYAQALYNIEKRPIRLALYFPLCEGWIEWEYHT